MAAVRLARLTFYVHPHVSNITVKRHCSPADHIAVKLRIVFFSGVQQQHFRRGKPHVLKGKFLEKFMIHLSAECARITQRIFYLHVAQVYQVFAEMNRFVIEQVAHLRISDFKVSAGDNGIPREPNAIAFVAYLQAAVCNALYITENCFEVRLQDIKIKPFRIKIYIQRFAGRIFIIV